MNKEEILRIVIKEGNRYVWKNSKTSYSCYLKRNPITGSWCGYVQLPKNHPFYNLNCLELKEKTGVTIQVHGGLVYSDRGVFGFDCSHNGDLCPLLINNSFSELNQNESYKTKEYTIKETNYLSEQLAKYENKKIFKTLSFEVTAKPLGNGSHILLPKSLLWKQLKVSIEVID